MESKFLLLVFCLFLLPLTINAGTQPDEVSVKLESSYIPQRGQHWLKGTASFN
jgi:hypothetical protein